MHAEFFHCRKLGYGEWQRANLCSPPIRPAAQKRFRTWGFFPLRIKPLECLDASQHAAGPELARLSKFAFIGQRQTVNTGKNTVQEFSAALLALG